MKTAAISVPAAGVGGSCQHSFDSVASKFKPSQRNYGADRAQTHGIVYIHTHI